MGLMGVDAGTGAACLGAAAVLTGLVFAGAAGVDAAAWAFAGAATGFFAPTADADPTQLLRLRFQS